MYATITSERAKKGQGGNEYLQINIFDEEKICHGTIEILPDMSAWIRYAGEKIEIKGKKQKGENQSAMNGVSASVHKANNQDHRIINIDDPIKIKCLNCEYFD